MKPKALIILVALTAIASQAALADGWLFHKGRFPQGKVTVFKLTKTQKAFIDLVRRCHTDNVLTPYVFTLTPAQSAVLRREVGFSPDRFAIVESYRGVVGVELEVNVINRFSEDEFEIPHLLLVGNRKAHDWEVNTIGWEPNPLFKANPADFKNTCPSTKPR